ncbi:unnamed protein product [Camellia sinensis]
MPSGYVQKGHEDKVYKLKKALYGLKQALRAWNTRIYQYFHDNGFEKCPYEHPLYLKKEADGNMLFACLYVDDLIFTGNNPTKFKEFKRSMVQEFEMTDIGLMAHFLSIEVAQRKDEIFMSQSGYATKILKRYGIENCNPVNTPVDSEVELKKGTKTGNVDPTYFKSLVGSLRYLTYTKPDILYGVGLISSYMETSDQSHLYATKRILCYIKGTIDDDLFYEPTNNFNLVGYSDSDWGCDLDERKSTTEFAFFMRNTVFTWSSKKQAIVTLLTCEAEHVAANSTMCHAIWLRNVSKHLGFPQENPTEIYVDNRSAIALAKNPVYHERRCSKCNNTTIVIIIATSVTGTVTILIVLFTIFLRKRKHKKPTEKIEIADEISGAESLRYDFSTIKDATDNFSDSNKLGQGGFGPVYKGKLPNGQEIAVKRLSKNSGQGEVEFKNEVLLVAKLQHRNLVRTLGFCMEGTERLLMYEFMPNGSLDHFLFDPNKQAYLDWDMRYKIIGGITRGLLYLHEDSRLRIIHRDMKASNVLLDENMNPKISDFGMARLFVLDETHGNTNKVVGTYGYMPPEYVTYGQFSIKSDVFSFGVLVLEIISGQKNSHFQKAENEENLLTYTWKNWKDGRASNVIDATILKASSNCVQDIMRCIHIGLLCVQENVANRPTMASVVLMLSSFSLTLSLPSQPAFFMQSTINPQSGSSNVNEASITELYPR